MRTEIRSKDGHLFALLLDLSDAQEGTSPASEHSWSLQTLLMRRPSGHVVRKHMHEILTKTSEQPMEALVVIRGAVEARIFDRIGKLAGTTNVAAGQCLLIVDGAHEITFTEDTIAYEFKPGPYKEDKIFL